METASTDVLDPLKIPIGLRRTLETDEHRQSLASAPGGGGIDAVMRDQTLNYAWAWGDVRGQWLLGTDPASGGTDHVPERQGDGSWDLGPD